MRWWYRCLGGWRGRDVVLGESFPSSDVLQRWDEATRARLGGLRLLSTVPPSHRSPFPCADVPIDVPGHGKVVVDIGYGGTFYAFLSAEQLGLDVCSSKTRDLVSAASAVTEAVKKQVGHRAALTAAD